MLSGIVVLVAGARGRMGQMFCRDLEAQGATVLRLGREELFGEQGAERFAPAFFEAARSTALVLLCVPVAAVGPVAARIATCLPVPEQAVWADICSIKAKPMETLARAVSGPVVGTHPLFGPTASSGLLERRIALVAGKRAEEEHAALVERVFTAMGCTVFRGTAEEHDRAVAVFQSLNFLTSAAFFSVAAATPGIAAYKTPSFARRMEASRILLLEDGELFANLTFQNDAVREAFSQCMKHLEELVKSPEAAAKILEQACSWWTTEQGFENGDKA